MAEKKTVGSPVVEVAIADIGVDYSYARELDGAWVDEIVSNWSPELFTAASIVKRSDGSLWVVDGQHRLAAASQLGYTHTMATVIPSSSLEQEAFLFASLNEAEDEDNDL